MFWEPKWCQTSIKIAPGVPPRRFRVTGRKKVVIRRKTQSKWCILGVRKSLILRLVHYHEFGVELVIFFDMDSVLFTFGRFRKIMHCTQGIRFLRLRHFNFPCVLDEFPFHALRVFFGRFWTDICLFLGSILDALGEQYYEQNTMQQLT